MDQIPVKTKQRHRSAAEWRELVCAWKQSGKTAELWCREQGVGRESLRRWSKRVRGTDKDVSFVEVQRSRVVDLEAAAIRFRILASGEVEILGEFDDELLRRVLRVVREAVHVC
jgi:hypothetical protein